MPMYLTVTSTLWTIISRIQFHNCTKLIANLSSPKGHIFSDIVYNSLKIKCFITYRKNNIGTKKKMKRETKLIEHFYLWMLNTKRN